MHRHDVREQRWCPQRSKSLAQDVYIYHQRHPLIFFTNCLRTNTITMPSTLNGLSYTKASIWPTCLGTDCTDNSDQADDSHVVRSGNIWRKGTQTRCSDHLPSEADQQPPDDDAGGLGSITFDIAQAIQEELSTVDDGDPFRMMSPSTGNLLTATFDSIRSLKEQGRPADAAALENAVRSIPLDSERAHSLVGRLKNWAASRDFVSVGDCGRDCVFKYDCITDTV